jgi:recombinational DNA repair protein RecR
MDIYGEKVNRLIGELGRLPGIGGKTAQRLAFHIINMPEEQVESLSAAITDAKKNIRYCKSCYTITDQELCPVCASPKRILNNVHISNFIFNIFREFHIADSNIERGQRLSTLECREKFRYRNLGEPA